MNIGAGQPQDFTSDKKNQKSAFEVKLAKDIKWMIDNHADIIMLQEVSDYWASFLERTIPENWWIWKPEKMKVATLHNRDKVRVLSQAVCFVWPEAERTNYYRKWRKFTKVRRRRGCGPPPSSWPHPVLATFLDLARLRTPHGRRSLDPWVGNGWWRGRGWCPGLVRGGHNVDRSSAS